MKRKAEFVQYMAEFDPEGCERNRQSGGYKGEVLRAVLVAHTERLKGSSLVTNAAGGQYFIHRGSFLPPPTQSVCHCGETRGEEGLLILNCLATR